MGAVQKMSWVGEDYPGWYQSSVRKVVYEEMGGEALNRAMSAIYPPHRCPYCNLSAVAGETRCDGCGAPT